MSSSDPDDYIVDLEPVEVESHEIQGQSTLPTIIERVEPWPYQIGINEVDEWPDIL